MTIRVGVFGAGGRMGSTVCQAVAADRDLELVAAVDPHHAGLDLSAVAGPTVGDLQIAHDADSLAAAGAQVVVDFTHLDAARANLAWLADAGIHAVVGTTGFDEADLARFRSEFTRSNCVIAPNFAIGAILMMRLAADAAPYFETAEVIEYHHDQKVDAPSGTAMLTAERIAELARDGSDLTVVLRDGSTVRGPLVSLGDRTIGFGAPGASIDWVDPEQIVSVAKIARPPTDAGHHRR